MLKGQREQLTGSPTGQVVVLLTSTVIMVKVRRNGVRLNGHGFIVDIRKVIKYNIETGGYTTKDRQIN